MRAITRALVGAAAALLLALSPVVSAQQRPPLYQQFLKPATPLELVAAKKVDRLAWVDYEEGKRNAFTAVGPAFTPVRLTNYLKDDGIQLSGIRISDDGSTVIFIRGGSPNRDGWYANANADPDGPDRAVWAARTTGGPAWRVADANNPELAPDGSAILFVRDGQIYRAKVSPVRPATERDRGEQAFITTWGEQSNPRWSPDGRKIAFVSTRTDHSFIVVYDVATRTTKYIDPGVDFDTMPMWLPDSRHLMFMRRPGLAFGQQAQQGTGSLGLPNGPAFAPGGATAGRGGRGAFAPGGASAAQGRGGEGPAPVVNNSPGLMRAAFAGGSTLKFFKADVTTGEAVETWHNQVNDPLVANLGNARLAGNFIVFPFNVGGGGRGGGRGRGVAPGPPDAPPQARGPVDEWERYYALNIMDTAARPVLLTTTDGLIEDQTSIALSADGKTFYYCTNAKDIERRHIWAVPVSGGTPVQITTGEGVETYPAPLSSGRFLATLSADWRRPQSVGIWTLGAASAAPMAARGPQKFVFPASLAGFPMDLHVKPETVITKAADGLEIHNQLFLPKNLKPGDKRPAIIFVHGGPVRQMLPAYHYMHFYHWAYGINQWLATQGYVVLSINYRSGVGYGRSFRNAPNTGGSGNSEYQDVVAGGKYLQLRSEVDPNRVGIWGLSYGGVLTGQALARNSDIFKAGVDLAGVHLWGSSLDPDAVSYKSSVIGAIDGWKSPVLLVHGDDDRNVAFQQTTGLVQLLRARNVYHELLVFPDDLHESLLHSRWLYTLDRMEKFLHKFLMETPVAGGGR
jgi:dipeptidyl aminopeptidase/acylaminoacyl peptidase